MTTTPATRDEYKDFDAWRKEQIAPLIRMGYPDAARAFNDLCFVQWAGWQARAERAALAESELAEVRERMNGHIGAAARERIYVRIAERLIDDHPHERTSGDYEYEHPLHDSIVALLAERDELRAELERVNASDDIALYAEIQKAAGTLPYGWEIRLCVEKDAGYVELYDGDQCSVDFPSNCDHLRYTVADAVEFAIDAARGVEG